jgi:hypothetical protein
VVDIGFDGAGVVAGALSVDGREVLRVVPVCFVVVGTDAAGLLPSGVAGVRVRVRSSAAAPPVPFCEATVRDSVLAGL